MTDRVPTYPGRVKLTPVSGETNKFDLEMADEPLQEGTPLNKANLLTDETINHFGLTGDRVPNDVFNFLAEYNKYNWQRREVSPIARKTNITTEVIVRSSSVIPTVYHSSELQFTFTDLSTITAELVNPQQITITVNADGAQMISSLAPCYLQIGTKIYYIPEEATGGTATSSTIRYVSSGTKVVLNTSASLKAQDVTASISFGGWQTISSWDKNAYPYFGILNNYEYHYIGGDLWGNTPSKIETGSYVGTDVYGASNPTSITFGFVPKLLIITARNGNSYSSTSVWDINTTYAYYLILPYGALIDSQSSRGAGFSTQKIFSLGYGQSTTHYTCQFDLSNDCKTFSWFSTTNSSQQLNAGNYVYYYTAIG